MRYGRSMTDSNLSQPDLLFELVLPMLCELEAKQIAPLAGRIAFAMPSKATGKPGPPTGPARSWTLAAKRPWISRGRDPKAEVVVEVDEDLASELLSGTQPNLGKAFSAGRIRISGKVDVLEGFESTMQRALSHMDDVVAEFRKMHAKK